MQRLAISPARQTSTASNLCTVIHAWRLAGIEVDESVLNVLLLHQRDRSSLHFINDEQVDHARDVWVEIFRSSSLVHSTTILWCRCEQRKL